MEYDFIKASHEISKLYLNFKQESVILHILWFRVMVQCGEWKISRHTHSTYEFHFVAEGESIVKLDNEEFIVREGQFYMTKPDDYHEQQYVEGKNYIEYSMNCDLQLLNTADEEWNIVDKVFQTTKCQPYDQADGLVALFEEALKAANDHKIGYFQVIRQYIILLIIKSSQLMNDNRLANYPITLKYRQDDFRFTQIDQYVKDNMSWMVKGSDLANYMYMSEKQIGRIIKKHSGFSTKQYLNHKKLKAAKEKLTTSDDSVKEIAKSLGFSSEYYFSQFFKREEGYPPSVFRNNVNII